MNYFGHLPKTNLFRTGLISKLQRRPWRDKDLPRSRLPSPLH